MVGERISQFLEDIRGQSESPLISERDELARDQAEKLAEAMKYTGGGCCGATRAAEDIRD